MSSYAFLTAESETPLWSNLAKFESALTRAFPDVRITERSADRLTEAIEWELGHTEGSSWMLGSIRQDALAIALRGDDQPVYETALWVQSIVGDAVLTWDWQGIPFALARLSSVEAIATAVEENDESLDYRQPLAGGGDD
jgi:hypothetical protein